MALDCLNNRIGIRACSAPASAGHGDTPDLPILFINDLPGITVDLINEMTNTDQDTYLELWSAIVKRTLLKFRTFVKAEFSKCWKLTSNEITDCLICANAADFDLALWYLHGVELMIEITSSYEQNRYTFDLDKAEKLKAEYFAEFQAALTDTVAAINPNDSECMEDQDEVIEPNNNPGFNWHLP